MKIFPLLLRRPLNSPHFPELITEKREPHSMRCVSMAAPVTLASLNPHSPEQPPPQPLPQPKSRRPRPQPSVVQIERAIGAGIFRDRDPRFVPAPIALHFSFPFPSIEFLTGNFGRNQGFRAEQDSVWPALVEFYWQDRRICREETPENWRVDQRSRREDFTLHWYFHWFHSLGNFLFSVWTFWWCPKSCCWLSSCRKANSGDYVSVDSTNLDLVAPSSCRNLEAAIQHPISW